MYDIVLHFWVALFKSWCRLTSFLLFYFSFPGGHCCPQSATVWVLLVEGVKRNISMWPSRSGGYDVRICFFLALMTILSNGTVWVILAEGIIINICRKAF